ncbi:cytochrome C oxidase subunit IV family protein [Benzoatithermus flavus]|uniref:Cytochrome C oxidase subunit IV family protein n=1 Tax=Benzoatithermus flavus TaxID=3108223 RepID=A0ABU8XRW8_9PROT
MTRSETFTFVAVYLALLVLLAATTAASFVDLGVWNAVVNLGIAALKAGLVAWFFMELRRAAALVRLAAVAGLFWLVLLFGLGFADFLTRTRFPS